MTQAHLCPSCGMFKILKEQHRPDGTFPSHDKYRRPGYNPVIKCADCIADEMLSEALRRQIRVRAVADWLREKLKKRKGG